MSNSDSVTHRSTERRRHMSDKKPQAGTVTDSVDQPSMRIRPTGEQRSVDQPSARIQPPTPPKK